MLQAVATLTAVTTLMTAPSASAMAVVAADAPPPRTGFSWVNLAILIVVATVAWPFYRWLRARVSRRRREQWAREEDWGPVYTQENDPDLRRDDPAPPA